jgi:hypothetical protein
MGVCVSACIIAACAVSARNNSNTKNTYLYAAYEPRDLVNILVRKCYTFDSHTVINEPKEELCSFISADSDLSINTIRFEPVRLPEKTLAVERCFSFLRPPNIKAYIEANLDLYTQDSSWELYDEQVVEKYTKDILDTYGVKPKTTYSASFSYIVDPCKKEKDINETLDR